MQVDALDHLVLTVANIEATCAFYERVMGMTAITFGENRRALRFGNQKINLHESGKEFEPKARVPQPGSADLCFLTHTAIAQVVHTLQQHKVEIIDGPVPRTGATHKLQSIYFRDPDGNLIEVSNPIEVIQ